MSYTNHIPDEDEVKNSEASYHQNKAARAAVARELMRAVVVSPELLKAKVALDDATATFRKLVREAAQTVAEGFSYR